MEINKKSDLLKGLQEVRVQEELSNHRSTMKVIANAHIELVKEQVSQWLVEEKKKMKKKT